MRNRLPAAVGRSYSGRLRAVGPELRDVRTTDELRVYARNRLIDSRLTPNAISLTGFVLNLVAAALILDRLFFLAGVAFIACNAATMQMKSSAKFASEHFKVAHRDLFVG